MIYTIKCRFCNAIGGTYILPDKFWDGRAITNQKIGIEDHRCDSCAAAFGNYKEMHKKYELEVGGSYKEFLNAVKLGGFKEADFTSVIEDIKNGNRDKAGKQKK